MAAIYRFVLNYFVLFFLVEKVFYEFPLSCQTNKNIFVSEWAKKVKVQEKCYHLNEICSQHVSV